MQGLVRNHELLRALPKPAVAAAATATLGLNVLVYEQFQQQRFLGLDNGGLLEVVILVGGLFVLFLEETGRRATSWNLSLPFNSRILWTAHLRALILAFSLVMVVMALVMAGFTQLLQLLKDSGLPAPGQVLAHFARPWLVLLAVATVMGTWRPGLADPGRSRGWVILRIGLGLGSLVLLTLLQFLPLPAALVPVLIAAGWSRAVCRGLAPSLVLAERRTSARPRELPSGGIRGDLVVQWVVMRELFKWPLNWIVGLPLVFLLGLMQGGGLSDAVDSDFMRYFNIWITVYLLVAFVGYFLENLHRVDHLPISRNMLLRWLFIPSVASLTLGGLIGWAIESGIEPGESLAFRVDPCCGEQGLLIPADKWRPAWGSAPTSVTAPWGESHPVISVAIAEGIPLYLYKPFTTRPEASPDFVAWQLSRAVEAVHGVYLSPDELRERYLVSGSTGQVVVRESGLTLVADGLVPPRDPVGPILPLLLGASVPAALVVCGLVFLMCGPGATRRRVKAVFWTSMGLLMVLHLGGYYLLMSKATQEWAVAGLIGGFAGRLAAMGGIGWGLAWLGAVLLSAAAWAFCASAFARVEAVRGGGSFTF